MSLKEFHDACGKGDVERVRAMLEAAKDPSALVEMRDEDEWTALHLAARSHCSDIVQMLLAASENPSALVAIQTIKGNTALHWASIRSSPEILVLLLAASKDPWALAAIRNVVGYTALRCFGNLPCMRVLLPYEFDFTPLETFDESERRLLRRAHPRRVWAFLETSLPEDLARALPDFM